MQTLEERVNDAPFRILYVGASGSGKTGSLISLLRAGYELRIIDLDNGLDALQNHCLAEDPKLLKQVQYETIRDKYKLSPKGPKTVGAPRTLNRVYDLLDKWPDGTDPSTWGLGKVLVLDSLSTLGTAALHWAKAADPTVKHKQYLYQAGQELIESMIATLTGEAFHTNVIVLTHYEMKEDGGMKAYPTSLGTALGPRLPRYFNTMILAETSGIGKSVKRKIKTLPTAFIDLKNPAPMKIEAEYPLETGLADIVSRLKPTYKE